MSEEGYNDLEMSLEKEEWKKKMDEGGGVKVAYEKNEEVDDQE